MEALVTNPCFWITIIVALLTLDNMVCTVFGLRRGRKNNENQIEEKE